MQQAAGLNFGDELFFRRGDYGPHLVQGLVDRPDAELDPQPVVEKFLDARPRQPQAQTQRDDEGRQTRPHQSPFPQRHRAQRRLDLTLGRLGLLTDSG